jgi:hypothetical protein
MQVQKVIKAKVAGLTNIKPHCEITEDLERIPPQFATGF